MPFYECVLFFTVKSISKLFFKKSSNMIMLEVVQRREPDWKQGGDQLGLSYILLCIQSPHIFLASSNSHIDANIFQNLQKHLGSSAEPWESVQQKSISIFCSLLACREGLASLSFGSRPPTSTSFQKASSCLFPFFLPFPIPQDRAGT